MGIIEAAKLAFEYKKYDENGEVEETIRAVDGVNLDVKKGDFVEQSVLKRLLLLLESR